MPEGTFMPEELNKNQASESLKVEKMPIKIQVARIGLLILGLIGIIAAFPLLFYILLFYIFKLWKLAAVSHTSSIAFTIILIYFVPLIIILVFLGIFTFITVKAIGNKKIWSKNTGIVLGTWTTLCSLSGMAVLGIVHLVTLFFFSFFMLFLIGILLGILIVIGLVGKEADNWFRSSPVSPSPTQPVAKKGMSTGAKVGMGVSIGCCVIILIVIVIYFAYLVIVNPRLW